MQREREEGGNGGVPAQRTGNDERHDGQRRRTASKGGEGANRRKKKMRRDRRASREGGAPKTGTHTHTTACREREWTGWGGAGRVWSVAKWAYTRGRRQEREEARGGEGDDTQKHTRRRRRRGGGRRRRGRGTCHNGGRYPSTHTQKITTRKGEKTTAAAAVAPKPAGPHVDQPRRAEGECRRRARDRGSTGSPGNLLRHEKFGD